MREMDVLSFLENNINKDWDFSVLGSSEHITCDFIDKHCDKPWNYKIISSNNLTSEFIEKHIEKLDAEKLSSNPCIHIAVVKNHPELNWNFSELSKNRGITMQDIEDNSDLNWDYEEIILNPNLTADFINKNVSKINFKRLHRAGFDFSELNLEKYDKNLYDFLACIVDVLYEIPYLKLDWKQFSKTDNVNRHDFNRLLEKHIDKDWDFDVLSANRSVQFELISRFTDRPWSFNKLSDRIGNSESEYTAYAQFLEKYRDREWNWEKLSSRYLCKELLVANYSDKPLDWIALSKDYRAIKLFQKYSDRPWDFAELSKSLLLTLEILEKYIDKDWDFQAISKPVYEHKTILTCEFIAKYPEKNYNWYVLTEIIAPKDMAFIEKHNNHDWNWTIITHYVKNWDFVGKNLDKAWDWKTLTFKALMCGMEGYKIVKENPDYPWDFTMIQYFKEDDWQFVEEHIDKNWNWDYILEYYKLPIDFIIRNYNKIKWDHAKLSKQFTSKYVDNEITIPHTSSNVKHDGYKKFKDLPGPPVKERRRYDSDFTKNPWDFETTASGYVRSKPLDVHKAGSDVVTNPSGRLTEAANRKIKEINVIDDANVDFNSIDLEVLDKLKLNENVLRMQIDEVEKMGLEPNSDDYVKYARALLTNSVRDFKDGVGVFDANTQPNAAVTRARRSGGFDIRDVVKTATTIPELSDNKLTE